MTIEVFMNSVDKWNDWANNEYCKQYDIALLKIWIQFEKFCSDIFIDYAIGRSSENGYTPTLQLDFRNEELLHAFLREGTKSYVDYFSKIETLSKHIFNPNPFDIIIVDSKYKPVCEQIKSIRNYIAHESNEAKRKLIKTCFNGHDADFEEPNEYLLKQRRTERSSNYTFFVKCLKEIVEYLVSPIE